MEEEFVPYEQSLALKEVGFDKHCLKFWNCSYNRNDDTKTLSLFKNEHIHSVKAPLYQQAFRWFRDKYNLRGFIGFRPNVKKFDFHIYDMSLSGMEYVKQRTMKEYNKDSLVGTYEEAELACLKKLIEIVKEKKV